MSIRCQLADLHDNRDHEQRFVRMRWQKQRRFCQPIQRLDFVQDVQLGLPGSVLEFVGSLAFKQSLILPPRQVFPASA